jgi:hypothetical protein
MPTPEPETLIIAVPAAVVIAVASLVAYWLKKR